MPYVFISYSKKNKAYAQLLKNELVRRGFAVWIDDVIEPSEDWWRNIRQAIKDSAAVMLIMTPQSETSHWVSLELLHALEYRKSIFPLLRDGDVNLMNSDVWSRIANIQYTDVRQGQLPPDAVFDKLRSLLKRTALPDDGWTPHIEVTATPEPVSPQTSALLEDFFQRAGQHREEVVPPAPAQPQMWGVENILPSPFEWVYVPPGAVKLGNETFSVDAFNIAKYPITNAQYELFIKAEDGYRDPIWWQDLGIFAAAWRKTDPMPRPRAFPDNNHPRANINYDEALAFCKWLAHRFNAPSPQLPPVKITLPTIQQWFRAGYGDQYKLFPWGNLMDFNRCNVKESGLEQTTPVTQYPTGASIYGVMDMVGNVSEWCLDTNPKKYNVPILGGSWADGYSYLPENVADISRAPFDARVNTIGFRIVMMNS
jgi:hypothetical protein